LGRHCVSGSGMLLGKVLSKRGKQGKKTTFGPREEVSAINFTREIPVRNLGGENFKGFVGRKFRESSWEGGELLTSPNACEALVAA